MRAEVAELVGSPALRYRADPTRLGHEGLGAALAGFDDAARVGIAALASDASELARRLEETAAAYADADAEAARRSDEHG
ncbi:hypothetical protein CNX65_01085 [Actinosynnema pretiosum]|uniref:ESX-1 secretion-associated protein n=1 Tax=Actinosynnema pretiosum TaxID=42197 RepID=A0A290YZ79_9PSEU|nr:hypothetical protein CNX65_01085 [Actinosynnema pretiosum]